MPWIIKHLRYYSLLYWLLLLSNITSITAAVGLYLQEDEDALFMLCLLSYQSKTCRVSVILTINFFFMTIFPEQRVPCPLSAPVNQTSALLDPYWCYHYTRFTNQQLQLLFELLNPPPHFIIRNGKCHTVAFVKRKNGDGGYQPWSTRFFFQ
jgi:hypothetical protein